MLAVDGELAKGKSGQDRGQKERAASQTAEPCSKLRIESHLLDLAVDCQSLVQAGAFITSKDTGSCRNIQTDQLEARVAGKDLLAEMSGKVLEKTETGIACKWERPLSLKGAQHPSAHEPGEDS